MNQHRLNNAPTPEAAQVVYFEFTFKLSILDQIVELSKNYTNDSQVPIEERTAYLDEMRDKIADLWKRHVGMSTELSVRIQEDITAILRLKVIKSDGLNDTAKNFVNTCKTKGVNFHPEATITIDSKWEEETAKATAA